MRRAFCQHGKIGLCGRDGEDSVVVVKTMIVASSRGCLTVV